MFMEERLEKIYEILKRDNNVKVKDLSLEFNVSEGMIRKDLAKLEKMYNIKRTYGGAILERQLVHNENTTSRVINNFEGKEEVAKKAINLIEENDVIARSSAGASAWVPVAIVNNLVRVVEKLKEAGFWVYGADAGGQTCGKIEFASKTVLIMGSEGQGISQLLEKQCDSIVSIPTCGKIDSLNVSVATGVLLYEIFRRKNI